jgi:hypothetical protein
MTPQARARREAGSTGTRRLVVVVALLLVSVLVSLVATTQGTSGAFVASVRNTANTANTASDFGRPVNALPYRSSFATDASDWTTYNGCWSTTTANGFGMYVDSCRGLGGNKAVTGRTDWTDYTLQADVKLDSGQQAGLLTRVTDPAVGTDAVTGYYAYFTSDGKLELGRTLDGTYAFLATTPIPGGISYNTWYHLVVQMKGCTVTVSQSTVGATGAGAVTSLTFVDTGCRPSRGMIGLRDHDATAAWRFVTATAGAASSGTPVTYASPWSTGTSPGFTTYGGTWTNDGTAETYSNTASGNGHKSIEARTWADMSLTGEVRFDAASQSYLDAGFTVRVRNPGLGTDVLNGYYGGVSRTSLVVGRHDRGTWSEFVRTPLATPLLQGQWLHLTVEMVGCRITVTAQPSAGGAQTVASHLDDGCTGTSGAVGVRTLGIPASFRSLAVTPR